MAARPDIDIEKRYSMPKQEAKKAVDRALAPVVERFDLKQRWDGDRMDFFRRGVKGHLVMTEDQVRIEVKLGFLIRPLKGKIESRLRTALDEHLT